MNQQVINFGILGPGKIAPRFVKGASFVSDAHLYAVYGRSEEKAKAFAKKHNILKVHSTQQELLADPEVDAIYIATPIMVHKEQIMAALHANKHVLCEKPMLVTKEDIIEASELAKSKGLLLMEAQKAPYISTTQWVKQAIKDDKLGEVMYVEASYGYDGSMFNDDHWVWDKVGGGAMWDVGVYPISFFMSIVEDDPIQSFSKVSKLHKKGADRFTHLQVKTQSGVVGSLSASLANDQVNTARVYGTKGMILIENFWKSNQLTLVQNDGEIDTITFDDPTDFAPYIAHTVECIKKGLSFSPIYNQYHWLKQIELISST